MRRSEEQSWLLWSTTNTIHEAFGFLETNAFLLSKLLLRFQVTRFHTHFCSLKGKFIKKLWSHHTHILSNVSNPGFLGFPLEEADPFVLFGSLSLTHSVLEMQRPEPHTPHPKCGCTMEELPWGCSPFSWLSGCHGSVSWGFKGTDHGDANSVFLERWLPVVNMIQTILQMILPKTSPWWALKSFWSSSPTAQHFTRQMSLLLTANLGMPDTHCYSRLLVRMLSNTRGTSRGSVAAAFPS